MPNKTFYLTPEKQESISIFWKGNWKQTSINFNGSEIGSFQNQKELKSGKDFELDSSRILSVKLKGQFYPELELLINGEVIAGSPSDPAIQLKQVVNYTIGFGSLSLIVGLIAELFAINILLNIGIGMGSIIFGAILIGLAFGVKRESMAALVLIFGLICLDIIGTFWLSAGSTGNPTNGILIKVFFLIFLFKGFGAIKQLKKKGKSPLQPQL